MGIYQLYVARSHCTSSLSAFLFQLPVQRAQRHMQQRGRHLKQMRWPGAPVLCNLLLSKPLNVVLDSALNHPQGVLRDLAGEHALGPSRRSQRGLGSAWLAFLLIR